MGDFEEKKIHNFQTKLMQESAMDSLKDYVAWQKEARINPDVSSPTFGPISINLDLTSACNYACPHCVDMDILNIGKFFKFDQIKASIETLCRKGLKSVILIGGGEPTLHTHFKEVVKFLKEKNLQVAIVSNGTGMQKIIEVADYFGPKDWIRLSLDSGADESFQIIHKPKTKITLYDICGKVKELKTRYPHVNVGFSFIAIWKGVKYKNVDLLDNIDELPDAVKLAADNGFSYFAVKPCLVKLEETGQESLLFKEQIRQAQEIAHRIKTKVDEAKKLHGSRINVVESTNLTAMFNMELEQFKTQTNVCHMTYFRQVLSPLGLYNCPAFRGESTAMIASRDAYLDDEKFNETIKRTKDHVLSFNPCVKCKEIVCIYNKANHYIEKLITGEIELDKLERLEDTEFYL